MPDLRARFATLDQAPMPDLWPEIERRAAAEAATVERVAIPSPTFLGAPLVGSSATRRVVLLLLLIGLLALAILGATLVGRWRLDPLRADTRTAGPKATAPATASSVIETEPFTSRLHGFSIRHPVGWETQFASQPWLGDGPPTSDQVDAFERPFSPNYERFTVASRVMNDDWAEERWIEAFVPLPAEVTPGGCTFGLGDADGPFTWRMRDAKLPEWERTFIAGHSATMRSICGHVDVVAFVDGRAYLLSLFSRSGVEGDTSLFRRFADTFQLTKAAPRPSPTPESTPTAPAIAAEAFTSPVYGYSIHPPEGWQVVPAAAAWDGAGPWAAGEADIATPASWMPGRRLTIVSTRLPAGMSGEAWIDAHTESLPLEWQAEGGHQHCVFTSGIGTMTTEGASVTVTDGVIDGRPASIRTVCGHITGTVIVDDRVFQLSLFVDRRPNGDRALFDAIMGTVDFDP